MTHAQLWDAIDNVAIERGLSTSGLALECQLDATTFNKSKRISPFGQPRWPTVETLLRVIKTSGMTPHEFCKRYGL